MRHSRNGPCAIANIKQFSCSSYQPSCPLTPPSSPLLSPPPLSPSAQSPPTLCTLPLLPLRTHRLAGFRKNSLCFVAHLCTYFYFPSSGDGAGKEHVIVFPCYSSCKKIFHYFPSLRHYFLCTKSVTLNRDRL